MASRRTHYVSVDVEASGPVPGLYSLLSIGATLVTASKKEPPTIGGSFYVELQPLPGAGEDAVALAHAGGLTVAGLAKTGKPPREALESFCTWLIDHRVKKPIFVAHCAPFDWMFVAYYFARFEVENPFGFAALDIKALAMGRLRTSWRETSTERLARKMAIEPQDPETLHHAGHDAAWQARLLCALLTA